MPINLDLSGSVHTREKPLDKAMFLVAWLLQSDWDPEDEEEMCSIQADLEAGAHFVKEHLINIKAS